MKNLWTEGNVVTCWTEVFAVLQCCTK